MTPTLAPGSVDAEDGFTLVELLIVLVMLGLISGVVALSFSAKNADVRADAERLASRIRAAHEGAIIKGELRSVHVRRDGYSFEVYDAGSWEGVAEPPSEIWKGGTSASGEKQRIVFDPSGLVTPARIKLMNGSESSVIALSPGGGVRVEPDQ